MGIGSNIGKFNKIIQEDNSVLKINNLSDVADKQVALNNLTGVNNAIAGQVLRKDANGNVVFADLPAVSPPYSFTFNGTTDWVANGTNWQITILQTAHLRGTNVASINCFLIDTNRRIKVMLGEEFDATTGNVILTVASGGRFAGMVKIN